MSGVPELDLGLQPEDVDVAVAWSVMVSESPWQDSMVCFAAASAAAGLKSA